LIFARLNYFQLTTEQPVDYVVKLRALAQYLADYLCLARKKNSCRRQLEILLFQAKIQQSLNEPDRAFRSLQEAVEIGRRGRYLRVFLEGGAEMEELLQLAVSRKLCVSYLYQIMEGFNCSQKKKVSLCKSHVSLDEPLSLRELEVLRLMAAGFANADIAKKLFISINTVKTHISHIFGKLGVASRTQAVAKARRLRLVD